MVGAGGNKRCGSELRTHLQVMIFACYLLSVIMNNSSLSLPQISSTPNLREGRRRGWRGSQDAVGQDRRMAWCQENPWDFGSGLGTECFSIVHIFKDNLQVYAHLGVMIAPEVTYGQSGECS